MSESVQMESLRGQWNRRESKLNRNTFAGLEYDTDLVSSAGIGVTLFAPPGTTRQQIAAAKRVARNRRDVVCFYVEKIPADWK